jgi:hypothetical protein
MQHGTFKLSSDDQMHTAFCCWQASWVPLSQALFQLVMAAVMLCMFVAEGLHLGRLYATFTIPLENGAVIGLLVPMLLACCVTASGLAGLNWQVG